MLELLRRYQRYIFFVVTFFVVISFSFFGTFNVLPSLQSHTSPAFTAVNGRTISRGEVEEMSTFLASDGDDKLLMGGVWGPNFLNDGVVRKDILETGIGGVLIERFGALLGDELQVRLEKEKRFRPYQHRQAPFLNATGVWAQIVPDLNRQLALLQGEEVATAPEAFRARAALYLAEHGFPAYFLQQMLLYQQKQQSWLQPDTELQYADLALFGYHSLKDWFGGRFLDLVSEFIINSALQAEEMGYTVSQAEVMADLARNAAMSFKALQTHPQLGVASETEYTRHQLQVMGLDQNRAIHIWRQVMLFRRLYGDRGAVPLIDRSAFEGFTAYARASVEGLIYMLPSELQLNSFRLLEQLEGYLQAVAPQSELKHLLELPTQFLPTATIAEKYPELVQKRYLLDIASIDKKTLQGRVSVKEMWEWQQSDAHWQTLQNQFPLLALAKAETPEARLGAIDGVDSSIRANINARTRAAIVDQHPEWIDEALAAATSEQKAVGIPLAGKQTTFPSIVDNAELIRHLDMASDSEEAQKHLSRYTGDGSIYYKIRVLEQQGSHLLSFGEAIRSDVLSSIVDKQLQANYKQLRNASPDDYRDADGRWKPFGLVRESIAAARYRDLLAAIRDEAVSAGFLLADAPPLTPDRAASLRLLYHVKRAQTHAKDGEPRGWVRSGNEPGNGPGNGEDSPSGVADQWQLVTQPFAETRAKQVPLVDRALAFTMNPGSWSAIQAPSNGAMSFFYVDKRGSDAAEQSLREKVEAAYTLLSHEAERSLATTLTAFMAEHGAIDISFADKAVSYSEMEATPPSSEETL